jgi:serine/threonine-protein kinase RsbW
MKKEFNLTCSSSSLTNFREELRTLLSGAGLSERKSGEVILAMDEALANISRHGYENGGGSIEVLFEDCGSKVEILIRDYGKKFDPTQAPEPELPPQRPGGLGIYFIKTVMDSVQYKAGPSGENQLLLTKLK